jgi:hypothetical protein
MPRRASTSSGRHDSAQPFYQRFDQPLLESDRVQDEHVFAKPILIDIHGRRACSQPLADLKCSHADTFLVDRELQYWKSVFTDATENRCAHTRHIREAARDRAEVLVKALDVGAVVTFCKASQRNKDRIGRGFKVAREEIVVVRGRSTSPEDSRWTNARRGRGAAARLT